MSIRRSFNLSKILLIAVTVVVTIPNKAESEQWVAITAKDPKLDGFAGRVTHLFVLDIDSAVYHNVSRAYLNTTIYDLSWSWGGDYIIYKAEAGNYYRALLDFKTPDFPIDNVFGRFHSAYYLPNGEILAGKPNAGWGIIDEGNNYSKLSNRPAEWAPGLTSFSVFGVMPPDGVIGVGNTKNHLNKAPENIVVVYPKQKTIKNLTQDDRLGSDYGTPSISHDGKKLAYRRGSFIEVMRLSVPKIKKKVISNTDILYLDWTKDARIVFTASPRGSYEKRRLYIINEDGSGQRDITPKGLIDVGRVKVRRN